MVDEAEKDEEQDEEAVIGEKTSQVLRNLRRSVGEGRRKAESRRV